MRVPLIDLATMHAPLAGALREKAIEVLDSHQYIHGPFVASFERAIADLLNVPHAIGVSSGTDALLAALMALDIGPGDEVITTPFTFFATAGSIARVGATPRFVDIDQDTFALDVDAVARAITPGTTKAILPVHLFGQMADMRALGELACAHDVHLIEDAAQAILARRDGLAAGSAGDIGCFSFFPTKNLGGAGDGGLITCQDDHLAERIRMICRHGAKPKYVHHVVGGNFRLDAMQAALLEVKLGALPGWTTARRENAAAYDALLSGVIKAPRTACDAHHVYHHYCVLLERRDGVKRALHEAGVSTAVYYPTPLHLQPCFAHLGYAPGDLPVAEAVSERILALPVWPGLTKAQIAHVAASLKGAIKA